MTPREAANQMYADMIAEAKEAGTVVLKGVMRHLALTDLFFLLTNVLRRPDADTDFCFDRCREIQDNCNGFLDLWAREHYKSTIKTFGEVIRRILNDPNVTIGIFSHTRPIAKAFLRQIKREFEENKILLDLFPEIVWESPSHQSPKWSEDEGIILRRTANPNAATVEAWGLVDGQPTSKHFRIRCYDDIVTRESITNPEMIQKTTKAWEDSQNLGVSDGTGEEWGTGTRWHFADTYRDMINRGSVKVRLYTEVDERTGLLHLWTPEIQKKKRVDMGPYTYACQIKQNPGESVREGFKKEWIQFWPADTAKGMNIYILCDPAGEKKKTNDFTVFFVVGTLSDENYYVLEIIRDRINLVERTNILFRIHRKYKKLCREVKVGYEKYGKDSDIEHVQSVMVTENYRFRIIPLGGTTLAKNDRIKRLISPYEAGRIYLPQRYMYRNYEGETLDMVQQYIEEDFLWFPYATFDDMSDCFARIMDPDLHVTFPGDYDPQESSKYTAAGLQYQRESTEQQGYDALRYGLGGAS